MKAKPSLSISAGILVTLMGLLLACKTDQPNPDLSTPGLLSPDQPIYTQSASSQMRYRLKGFILFNQSLGSASITYQYNQAGRVSSYVTKVNEQSQVATFQYDALQRVVAVDLPAMNSSSAGANQARATYEYNQAGSLTTIRTFYAPTVGSALQPVETYSLAYDGSKLPTTLTRTTTGTDVYSYTYVNQNVTQLGLATVSPPYTRQYNDSPNPLYGLLTFSPAATAQTRINSFTGNLSFSTTNSRDFYGFVVEPEVLFSQNNRADSNKLIFDSNGLLSQLTVERGDGFKKESVIYYFSYETY